MSEKIHYQMLNNLSKISLISIVLKLAGHDLIINPTKFLLLKETATLEPGAIFVDE